MLKRALILLLLAVAAVQVDAQDLAQYKKVVKELSSPKYQGRGYARGGANKAGKFLEKEFRKSGVDAVSRQYFTLDINTFAGKMKLSVDGRKMVPGIDFTLREFSPGVHGTYHLYHIDTLNYNSEKIFSDLAKPEYKDAFVVCDFWFTYKHRADFQKLSVGVGGLVGDDEVGKQGQQSPNYDIEARYHSELVAAETLPCQCFR